VLRLKKYSIIYILNKRGKKVQTSKKVYKIDKKYNKNNNYECYIVKANNKIIILIFINANYSNN
jgi:hypothetical protein